MSSMTLNVRITGPLSDFVAANVGAAGRYENVSEYVRDLIRKDMAHAEQQAFERLKAELGAAFAAPEDSYTPLSASDVIARNQRRRSA
jgi:putative addiction module CopG family antidote